MQLIYIIFRRNNLEIKASGYVVKTTLENIGWGLFSKNNLIKKGEIITMFVGSNITNEEWNRRARQGYGGYGVYLNRSTIKDCRESFSKKECFASAVNCSKNLIDINSQEKADHNCYMVIKEGNIYLKSKNDIEPFKEILLEKYAKNYKMVSSYQLVKDFLNS